MKKYFLLFIILGINNFLFSQDWYSIFKQLYIPSLQISSLALPTQNMYIPTWKQWENGQRMMNRCYAYKLNGELVIWDQGRNSILFLKNGALIRLIKSSELKNFSTFFQKSADFYGIGFDEREEKIYLYFGRVGVLVYNIYSLDLLQEINYTESFFMNRNIVNNGIIDDFARNGKLNFFDFEKNQKTIFDLKNLNNSARLQSYLEIDSISANHLLASPAAPYFIHDLMILNTRESQSTAGDILRECVNILYQDTLEYNNTIFDNSSISYYLGSDANQNYYYFGSLEEQLNKTVNALFVFNKKLHLIQILDIEYSQFGCYIMPNGDIKQIRTIKKTSYKSKDELVYDLFETTIKNTWDPISAKQVDQYLAKMGLANTN